MTMRWYARPEGDKLKLRVIPQPDPWLKNDHPATGRLRTYPEDTAVFDARESLKNRLNGLDAGVREDCEMQVWQQ